MSTSQMSRAGSGSLTGRPTRVSNTFATQRKQQPIKLFRNTYQIRAGNPLIGKVNNPEETRKNAQEKKTDSEWASPGKNPNKLEKSTAFRAGSETAEHGGVGDAVSEAVDSAKEAVKDVADKVTGKD